MHHPSHFSRYLVFIICWIATGIGAGLYLLRQTAPYGRFSRKDWGPMISNKLGWLLMEATVIVTFLLTLSLNSFNWRTPAGLMVGLFLFHYVHRSLIYPMMIRTRGKKMPIIIMLSAMLFNTVNGSLLGYWFAAFAHYPDDWLSSLPFICGVLLFMGGLIINWRADYYLIRLRKKGGDVGYSIPRRGLFNYVSSPNLLGEIIEWGGYALLTWSAPALAFFVWTCANLLPRAIANHRWYHREFPDYPAARKILLPFIW
jgi:3-oxo-5-alpha-steroid 4-dehydrogenase 1